MIKSGMEKEVQYWYEEHKQSTGESGGLMGNPVSGEAGAKKIDRTEQVGCTEPVVHIILEERAEWL